MRIVETEVTRKLQIDTKEQAWPQSSDTLLFKMLLHKWTHFERRKDIEGNYFVHHTNISYHNILYSMKRNSSQQIANRKSQEQHRQPQQNITPLQQENPAI